MLTQAAAGITPGVMQHATEHVVICNRSKVSGASSSRKAVIQSLHVSLRSEKVINTGTGVLFFRVLCQDTSTHYQMAGRAEDTIHTSM